MGPLDHETKETVAKGRVFSSGLTTTDNGSAMVAHNLVSNYGSDGAITPTSTAGVDGGDLILYSFTIRDTLPDGTYKLGLFRATPVIGEAFDYIPFTVSDGALVTLEGQQDDLDSIESSISSTQSDVTTLQSQMAAFSAALSAMSAALVPSGDYATDLRAYKSRVMTVLLAGTHLKPDYNIDGQNVSWGQFSKSLEEKLDWIDQKLMAVSPVEIVTEAYP